VKLDILEVGVIAYNPNPAALPRPTAVNRFDHNADDRKVRVVEADDEKGLS